eukprot:352115-Chlamydomonas_euryale.AAC.5
MQHEGLLKCAVSAWAAQGLVDPANLSPGLDLAGHFHAHEEALSSSGDHSPSQARGACLNAHRLVRQLICSSAQRFRRGESIGNREPKEAEMATLASPAG